MAPDLIFFVFPSPAAVSPVRERREGVGTEEEEGGGREGRRAGVLREGGGGRRPPRGAPCLHCSRFPSSSARGSRRLLISSSASGGWREIHGAAISPAPDLLLFSVLNSSVGIDRGVPLISIIRLASPRLMYRFLSKSTSGSNGARRAFLRVHSALALRQLLQKAAFSFWLPRERWDKEFAKLQNG